MISYLVRLGQFVVARLEEIAGLVPLSCHDMIESAVLKDEK